MKRLSWKYVAGLIDGEGCVKVGFRIKKVHGTQGQHGGEERTTIYPQIIMELTLTEASKHVIEMLANNYGGNTYRREYPSPNWKPTYTWKLTDKTQCRSLFQNIMNHCFIKNEQMRFAIFCYDKVRGQITKELADAIKNEFKLLKADPHRLSEKAVERIKPLMR